MKNTSLDAKREEFRKYLEKEGVLEYLIVIMLQPFKCEACDFTGSRTEIPKTSYSGNSYKKEELQL